MIKKNYWFSLLEVVISIFIVSIFLLWAYSAINNYYSIIWYIDVNINWLNMSKTAIDELSNIRDEYLKNYPYNWWEKFMIDFWTWTFKLSRKKCNLTDDYKDTYLCKINDKIEEYEWPMDNLWEYINSKEWIYFYRKIDLSMENSFYLKNIYRIRNIDKEDIVLKFSDTIFNYNNILLSWDFDNNNSEVSFSWLNINFYNINWELSDWLFSNINNTNLRYSKVLEYDYLSNISDLDYLIYNSDTKNIKFQFVDYIDNSFTWTWIVPIEISDDINKNYYNLCNQMNKNLNIDCKFNYIFEDNFYNKLVGIEQELSWVNFGDNFNFSFSWSNYNEIWITLDLWILPTNDTNIYINPYWEIKKLNNRDNKNDLLSLISDSSSWLWIEIPDLPINIWWINTNTWYTSLLNVKVTTYSYNWIKDINDYVIESKIWDINRYIRYYE